MKQCVKFPEDKFLAVRTCLVAICMGNRPAANLLSILLFRYNLRMENKDDAENQNAVKTARGESPDQDTSVRIFRTQAQLVDDMCGEMTEKTLHDTAVPMLQLLGFLDLEEHMIANCYILHVDLVQQALNLYIPGKKEQGQLEKFLISTMTPQLEKFRIDLYGLQLEEVLIDKKFFLSGLEKVLIQNRKISNYRRGRKTAPGVARKAKSQLPKNIEEESKKDIQEEREVFAFAHTAHAQNEDENDFHFEEGDDTPTEKTPIVTIGATDVTTLAPSDHVHSRGDSTADLSDSSTDHRTQGQVAIASTPGEATPPPVAEVRQSRPSPGDGAATPVSVDRGGSRASGGKPKRQRKKPVAVQLSLDGERLKEWYDELRGLSTSLSKRNVTAWESLARKKGSDDKEIFLNVVACLDDDPWFEEHKVGVDPYWIDRQWENKYIFLQRKKPAPLADKKPVDIYTANSQDKEKMRRRIEEMKANAARKGIQVPGQHGTN